MATAAVVRCSQKKMLPNCGTIIRNLLTFSRVLWLVRDSIGPKMLCGTSIPAGLHRAPCPFSHLRPRPEIAALSSRAPAAAHRRRRVPNGARWPSTRPFTPDLPDVRLSILRATTSSRPRKSVRKRAIFASGGDRSFTARRSTSFSLSATWDEPPSIPEPGPIWSSLIARRPTCPSSSLSNPQTTNWARAGSRRHWW